MALAVGLFSCADGGSMSMGGADAGLQRSERYAADQRQGSPGPTGAPAAMVGGEAIGWEQLRPIMAEASGGRALEEVALDRLLEREARARGVTIGAEEIERERRQLLDSLDPGGADAPRRAELLEEIRRSRGLGDVRFAALLRRNALLRALVAAEIEVDDEAARRMYELRYGDRIGARLITTPSLQQAQAAAGRLRAGEPFPEVAATLSTDRSAARGGLIEPIHPSDPSYPASLRQALMRLADGGVSPPVALDQGYAIVMREGIVRSSSPPFEEVEEAMLHEARLAQERSLMDRLARRLLESAGVTVLDRSLDWSWRARTGEAPGAGR